MRLYFLRSSRPPQLLPNTPRLCATPADSPLPKHPTLLLRDSSSRVPKRWQTAPPTSSNPSKWVERLTFVSDLERLYCKNVTVRLCCHVRRSMVLSTRRTDRSVRRPLGLSSRLWITLPPSLPTQSFPACLLRSARRCVIHNSDASQ